MYSDIDSNSIQNILYLKDKHEPPSALATKVEHS